MAVASIESRPAPNSSSKREELAFVAGNIQGIVSLQPRSESRIKPPLRTDQAEVIFRVFPQYPNGEFFNETINHPFAKGRTRQELLMEYATFQLARQLAFEEKRLLLDRQAMFYVHDAGQELASIALQRQLTNDDPWGAYYRGQTGDIYRGGSVKAWLAQTLKREGDTHSETFQLAGHAASAERNIPPVISNTGAHTLAAAGIGKVIKGTGLVSVADLGEATFAQSSVKDAVEQAVFDQSPTVYVVYDNLAGISMEREDTSIEGDPIKSARAFADSGLLIKEVDGTDLVGLMDAAEETIGYARKSNKPAVLHITNLYRVTDHTSSSDQNRYIDSDELKRRQGFDPLSAYKKLLAEMGVATAGQIDQIETSAKEYVAEAAREVLARPAVDPKRIYNHVYALAFRYGPERISVDPTAPTIDRLQSTREEGVIYTDKDDRTQEITGKQHLQLTLAQALREYPNLVIYGEDVGTLSSPIWRDLPRVLDRRIEALSNKYSPAELDQAREAMDLVRRCKGFEANPEALGIFADIIRGKGNVFGVTYGLDFLAGKDRVFSFPLNEARIVGSAIGRAIAGQIPVVEIQFGPYSSSAFEQIWDQLASIRWRSRGQFQAGMVIRIPGMNRIGGAGIGSGGVGGLGHGEAFVNRFNVPGIRHVIPGDVSEMGPLLKESIRVAAEHKEVVIFHEPISLYSERGFYQGFDAHIPLGEAEVRRQGTDLTLLAWSNNVMIADAAAEALGTEGFSVGVVNTRTVGTHELDWDKIGREIRKSNRVLVVEAGRGEDSRPITGVISEHYFDDLAAPVRTLTARNVPVPAGKSNEAYVVPQRADVIESARELILR